ncbi:MAG: diaminopimelate decarboxylase [Anaerolineae bacterium]
MNPCEHTDQIFRLLPVSAGRDGDRLTIAGHDVVALAQQFGTPLYVYDEATLEANVDSYERALRASYAGPWEISYASKAFLCLALAQWCHRRGLGLDVVSGGELALALQAGFPPDKIHLHGNNKTDDELNLALDAGVGRIVLDHPQEIPRLERLAAERGMVADVWMRVTPGIDVHTHAYTATGHVETKFGFHLAEGIAERAAREVLASPHLRLRGLHVHLGSQLFDAEPIALALRELWRLADRLRGQGGILEEVSSGGGWGVPYHLEAPAASVERYVQRLAAELIQLAEQRGDPPPRWVLEPGRSLVARAGIAVYRVGAVKRIPGRTYVLIDGGLADNPRPALYQARYTALIANRLGQLPTETVAVAGPYCESGDVLIHEVALPDVQPGDILVVPMSGAYHLSMASNYNGALRPAVVWASRRGVQLIRRREVVEDLWRRDVALRA